MSAAVAQIRLPAANGLGASGVAVPQAATAAPWLHGTIKWFDTVRRYGFISPDDGDRDVFLYFTTLRACGIRENDVVDGARVTFLMEETPRRPQATKVRLLTAR